MATTSTQPKPSQSSFGFTLEEAKNSRTCWIVFLLVLTALVFYFAGDKISACLGSSTKAPTTPPTVAKPIQAQAAAQPSSNHAYEDLEVNLLMTPQCPWCTKAMAMLKDENKLDSTTVHDVSTPEGQAKAQELNLIGQGVPTFHSTKTGVTAVGFRPVAEVVKALNQQKKPKLNAEGKHTIAELDVLFFKSDGCPWCTKMSKVLEDDGALGSVEVVDIGTAEGKEMVKKYLPEFKGVPALHSKKTGKTQVGFVPSVDKILETVKG